MYVAEIWRFPVKSLAGERLRSAHLTKAGVPGDRIIHVRSDRGVVTARTRHGLLRLSSTTDADGAIRIDGVPWDDPRSLRRVRQAAGAPVELAAYDGPERFDVLPLLVATDGAIADFGADGRRLRPNIIIGGVRGQAERGWPGRALRIGETVIGVESLRGRCIVTTINPDTGDMDPEVLRDINGRFDGRLALNCWVAQPGEIAVGDPVTLSDETLPLPSRGGWVLGAPYAVTVPPPPDPRLNRRAPSRLPSATA